MKKAGVHASCREEFLPVERGCTLMIELCACLYASSVGLVGVSWGLWVASASQCGARHMWCLSLINCIYFVLVSVRHSKRGRI